MLYKNKLILVLMICFAINKLNTQTINLKSLESRIRLNYDYIKMQEEPSIGFLGLGYDLFNLIDNSGKLYLGINSFSAMEGKRGGFFAYGFEAGLKLPLLNKKFSLDLSGFLGGGGGASAPDGGGLIIKYSADLEYQIKNLGLRIGYSKFVMPNGNINSNQFSFGLTLYNNKIVKTENETQTNSFVKPNNIDITDFRVGIVTTAYIDMKKEMVGMKNADLSKLVLIGIQYDDFFTNNLFASLEANGVITGGFGGYLAYMAGIGFLYPSQTSIAIETRAMLGSAGGGAVKTGGGAIYHLEIGPVINILDDYYIKLLFGKTISFNEKLNVNNLDFVLSKEFNSL